jgi:hypothetical protein
LPFFSLDQFSSRGELPAFVVYSTPGSTPSKTTGYAAESSLRDILDAVSQDDDLRAKFRLFEKEVKMILYFDLSSSCNIKRFLWAFSNYLQHTESERTSDSIQMAEEMEPNVIVYPAQHGIRKHGRWNSRPRHVRTLNCSY